MTRSLTAGSFVAALALIGASPNLFAFQHQGGGTSHVSSFHPLNAHVGSPHTAGHMAGSHATTTHSGTAHVAGGMHSGGLSHGVSVGGVHHTGLGVSSPAHHASAP